MSTKHRSRSMQLLTLFCVLAGECVLVSVAAQQTDHQPNVSEQAFQESGSARTGFPIFDEEIIDLRRIEALLSQNISAEIKGDALARAAAHGDVELLQLLIRNGADVNYAVDQGQTVLMLAAARGIYSQCGNDPLLTFYRGNVEEVKSLLAAGARVDDADGDGNTALMLASKNARSDCVKLLLDAGANVQVKNKYGWTALIYAAISNGHNPANMLEIVVALINAGVELNARDHRLHISRCSHLRSWSDNHLMKTNPVWEPVRFTGKLNSCPLFVRASTKTVSAMPGAEGERSKGDYSLGCKSKEAAALNAPQPRLAVWWYAFER
jgi:hypothetical protein